MLNSVVSRPAGTDQQSTLRGQIRRQHTQPGRRRSRSIRVRISRRRLFRLSISLATFLSIYGARNTSVFGAWKIPRFTVALPVTSLHRGSRSFSECCVERPCHQELSSQSGSDLARLVMSAEAEERAMSETRVAAIASRSSDRRTVGGLVEAGRSAARACGKVSRVAGLGQSPGDAGRCRTGRSGSLVTRISAPD
jgi:hypothetical protein